MPCKSKKGKQYNGQMKSYFKKRVVRTELEIYMFITSEFNNKVLLNNTPPLLNTIKQTNKCIHCIISYTKSAHQMSIIGTNIHIKG